MADGAALHHALNLLPRLNFLLENLNVTIPPSYSGWNLRGFFEEEDSEVGDFR
jgi:hypothetical protein